MILAATTGEKSPSHKLRFDSAYDEPVSTRFLTNSEPIRVYADFNGLFGDLLCLSHRETCRDAKGKDIAVREGMTVTAFQEDFDDTGKPDNLIASGVVERPPESLSHAGSRWVLRIDANGVRHESDLQEGKYGL